VEISGKKRVEMQKLTSTREKLKASIASASTKSPTIRSQWSILPEDLTIFILSFLSGKDLVTSSQVSRLFYFGATHTAFKRFDSAFGGRPDASLPRSLLFHLIDRADSIMSISSLLQNNPHNSLAIITAADRDPGLRDLFLWSSMRGYLKMMKTLVSLSNAAPSGMSLHSLMDSKQPSTGATALMLACEYKQSHCVTFLTKSCLVDHTATALNGLNAFHICARLGHLEILSQLLEKDKSLAKSLVLPDGRTALHLAVFGGHVAVVKKLLSEGIDPDIATTVHDDTGNETSLHIAAYLGHVDIVSLLLTAGANPNIQMRNGRTPLLLACEIGWKDVALLLLTRSFVFPVDLSLTTDSGKSALYCAIESGVDDLVGPLLESGSNALQATRRNKSSFYVAAEKGNLYAARLLLENADESGILGPLVESAKAKINNKGMKELVSLYLSPNGSPRNRNRSRGRPIMRIPTGVDATSVSSTAARSPSVSAVATAGGGISTNSDNLVNSAVMAAFVFTGGSGSSLTTAAASVLRRAAAAGGIPGGGLPRSTQAPLQQPLVLAPAARQLQQQLLAQQNPSVGALSAMHAVLAGAGGNTAGEVMIRERARREAEEAEAFLRNAELMEKHRRQAADLAEKARKRLEEKAASDAAAEASLKAEAEAKKEREEKKRADKDRQIRLDFLKRSADREDKEKALLESLALTPTSPRGGPGPGSSAISPMRLNFSEGDDVRQESVNKSVHQPSPKLLSSPYAAKLIKRSGVKRKKSHEKEEAEKKNVSNKTSEKGGEESNDDDDENNDGDDDSNNDDDDNNNDDKDVSRKATTNGRTLSNGLLSKTTSASSTTTAAVMSFRTYETTAAVPKATKTKSTIMLKSTSVVAPGGNVVVMRAAPKVVEKEKLELKAATFSFSI
jgi:ankyrin repeat protein